MRTMLLAAIALAAGAGCLAESARPSSYRAPAMGPEVTTCADERVTGSMIPRQVCRTENASPNEHMAASAWRNRLHANPTRDGSHSMTTPFLHVYQ